jgi:hypothetical protein
MPRTICIDEQITGRPSPSQNGHSGVATASLVPWARSGAKRVAIDGIAQWQSTVSVCDRAG